MLKLIDSNVLTNTVKRFTIHSHHKRDLSHMQSNQTSSDFFLKSEQDFSGASVISQALMTTSLVQSHRHCPKRAWLEFHTSDAAELTSSARGILAQGQNVHQAARTLYPDANTIRHDLLPIDAAHETALALTGNAGVVLGASFVSDTMGMSVRLDALEQAATGYKITNFASGSDVKDEYLDAAAIDLACLQSNAISVEEINVMHPSTKIALPENGTGAEVLITENVTNEVQTRSIYAVKWIKNCADTLASDMPFCETGDHCKKPMVCPFSSKCGVLDEIKDIDLIEYLPSKSGLIEEYILDGTKSISKIPFSAMTNKRNALVRTAILQGGAVVSRELADFVRSLPYPRFVLDFETAAFAIPRFAGMHAYQPLPFQFSMHSKSVPFAGLVHQEFIDVTGNDPRVGFMDSLLNAVGESGPVFVYSPFEKTRLKELADDFPAYREKLLALVERLVDLLPLARQGYYHPEQRGSWSLKAIQPTLPPCDDLLAYSAMEDVADGLAAQAAYMDQIDPCFIGEQKDKQLTNMKVYCKADTRGLAHFVDVIEASADVEVVCAVPPPKPARKQASRAKSQCAVAA
jgi:hypothetical protein